MYGVRLVPAVDDSVGDTALAASEAALEMRFTQVPFEQTCPVLQSASLLQEAPRAGSFVTSAAASVTAKANLQVIRPLFRARDRASRAPIDDSARNARPMSHSRQGLCMALRAPVGAN